MQVKFCGDADLKLAQRVILPFGGFESKVYTVSKIIRSKNAGGAVTTVSFALEMEERYVNYVAEQKL